MSLKTTDASFKTADLCDDFSGEIQVIGSEFKSYGGKKRFSGPIQTVKVFEDNVLVKKALETIPEGSVLVVDGGGSKNCALMGDRLGEIAESRKISGVIIYGCVRDCCGSCQTKYRRVRFGNEPVKEQKRGQRRSQRSSPIPRGEWKPGEYVYADEDGIVIAGRKLD